MSKKRLSGPDALYRNHLHGSRYYNDPANNRFALIERMYLRVLTELATNRFKWSGLPEEIDVRFLELTLFNFGLSVFFKDDAEVNKADVHKATDKFMALQGGANGRLNMLNNPTAFRVVGNNFVGKTISAKNCVPIWANYLRVPDLDIVTIYAERLADFDRTIEINARNARRTKIVATNENQRMSTSNIVKAIDSGEPVINVTGPIQDMAFVSALDLGIHPDQIINMQIARRRVWDECMGLLGIENANQDKKERLVSSEVDANSDQTDTMRNVNLNARRMAAEEINRRYKLNVSVDFHTETQRDTDESDDTETESDNNE